MKRVSSSLATPTSSNPGWLLLRAACLFLAMFTVNSLTVAQESEDIEQAEPVAGQETEQQALERARAEEVARQLELRLQAIDELQGSRGIYAPELQEAYSDLAGLYQEIEDYESAISVYNEALQISRINTGLYSNQQLPIIKSLIDSNGRLRNWEQADKLQELRYHISSRLYDLDDLAYLEAAENYADWKLRLLRENLLDMNYRSYSRSAEELSDFYERLIANLDAQPNYRPENMIDLFQGKSAADLVLVRAIASTPYTAFEGTVSRYIYQQRCRNVRTASGEIVRECVNVQVENPRYRQSQVDAKRFAMDRSSRDVQESIHRLRQIYEQSDLGTEESEQLESQIAELETETLQLLRQSRSRRRF
ncbi:MAG: hypothetical protein WDZ52_01725 [Pseudohongiellaceae bacterium]